MLLKKRMKNKFNKAVAGSFYHLGPEDSPQKILLMHGQASSAHNMQLVAEKMSVHLPHADIIVPNGGFEVEKHMFPQGHEIDWPDNHYGYTWYPIHQDHKDVKDTLPPLLDELKSDPDNRIYMVGFSMGGFRAGEEILNAPAHFAGAVLHSSAIINAPKKIEKQISKPKWGDPPKLLTLMGAKDPYLRQKWAIALLPIHYKNQWNANRAGVKSSTKFIWNLRHEMSDQSIESSAKHIQDIENAL